MNDEGLKLALMESAIMASVAENYYMTGHGRTIKKRESPEDKERRKKCEQMAIQKALAKRERKAAKRKRRSGKI